jgi:hypothetical protein
MQIMRGQTETHLVMTDGVRNYIIPIGQENDLKIETYPITRPPRVDEPRTKMAAIGIQLSIISNAGDVVVVDIMKPMETGINYCPLCRSEMGDELPDKCPACGEVLFSKRAKRKSQKIEFKNDIIRKEFIRIFNEKPDLVLEVLKQQAREVAKEEVCSKTFGLKNSINKHTHDSTGTACLALNRMMRTIENVEIPIVADKEIEEVRYLIHMLETTRMKKIFPGLSNQRIYDGILNQMLESQCECAGEEEDPSCDCPS